MVLARIGAGDQMLAAILGPAERLLARERQPGDGEFLRLQLAFVAEAAADIGRRHPDGRLRDLQELAKAGADQMRDLGGGVHDELPGAVIPPGQQTLALHRVHHLAGAGELQVDAHRGVFRHRSDAAVELGLQEQIVAPVFVQQRSTRVASGGNRGDRGELLVLHLDGLGEVLGLGPGLGHAHGDDLADMAHAVARDRRILRHLVAGDRGAGDDRQNSG